MTRIAVAALLVATACTESPTWMSVCWEGDRVASYEGQCEKPTRIVWKSLPLSVATDETVPQAFASDIAAAIRRWNGQVGLDLFAAAAPQDSADVVVAFGAARAGSNAATQHWRTDGRTRARVECRACALTGQTADLIAHEFGHVLGLAHDPQRGSLMHAEPPDPMAGIVRDVQTADRNALRKQYGGP